MRLWEKRRALGPRAGVRGPQQLAIADRLFISAKTMSGHVPNILAKLGVSSRTEAAAVARRDEMLLD